MKRLLFTLGLTAALAATPFHVSAQRKTDVLGRGLVAVKKAAGVYLSWRITAEEYYDVTFNVYRDGTLLNEEPLDVSNYLDRSGTVTSTYTVRPVVRGVEGEACEAVEVWKQNYKEITLPTVIGKDGEDITSQYQPNDISVADLDGDGEMELIVRRINVTDQASVWDVSQKDYTRLDIIKQDGTLLWWIDIGPNMFSPNQMESNAVAFDWPHHPCCRRHRDGDWLRDGELQKFHCLARSQQCLRDARHRVSSLSGRSYRQHLP